ncbi:MAG: PKD domain-containing protein [Rhodothermia bacterium]|nr:PKD domain-containing protein [Rhodothermia bacterium]
MIYRIATTLVVLPLFAGVTLGQTITSFDPRGLVIGLGAGTGTFSGDLGSAFDEANASFRFDAHYNTSRRLSFGLTFISSKYGLTGDSRGSLGLGARYRFLEDAWSPFASAGFHILNGGDKTGAGPTAGLGIDFATSDRFSLYIEGLWQGSTPDDAFEGREGGSSLDNLITVGIGARFRLTQPKRPRFSVSVVAPDTVLVGDIINLKAIVDGDPSSPVFISWRIEQVREYRGEDIRHAFQYLGPQQVTVIAQNERYEIRQTKDLFVVDDPIYERDDDLLPGAPTRVAGHVRVLEIYGERQLEVGEIQNYRLRLRPGARWPINYRWDMGDGTILIGNNVLHRYSNPGSYRVTAVARNGISADTLFTEVLVSQPETAATTGETARPDATTSENSAGRRSPRYHPDELRSRSGIDVSAGGYGWSVGNYMDRQSAEQRMRQFKVRGFRTDIVTDAQGGGSPVYRVVVGQFASSGSALSAKREIQRLNDIPISLIEIGSPSRSETPVRITPPATPRPRAPVPDDTPPVISRPVVRHIGPENATTLDVSRLSASDPESRIAKLEYRIVSADGKEVWTDWTTIVEPNTASAETSTVAELPMFADDQEVLLEARATNGRGLTATSSVTVSVDVDETPPVFDRTDIEVARIDDDLVLDLVLAVDDRESGVAQARYRVVDQQTNEVYSGWTDVTGRPRVLLSLTQAGIEGPKTVIVELEAQNGAGAVNAYAKSVQIPEIAAVSSSPGRIVTTSGPSGPAVAPPDPTATTPDPAATTPDPAVDPSVPGPAVKSMKVYIRENRLLVFLDGISDASSAIQQVDYRVLDASGDVLAGWSPISLVPPGKQSYGLQMHRLPVPSGASNESSVEVRVTNTVGGRTVVRETVGADS